MDIKGNMTYQEIEEYLQEIPKFAGKNEPKTTKAFYQKLGSPAADCKVIHIAGTNGKGSVCAYLQGVFLEAGYRVGMFTSPHLVTTRERVKINGNMVSEEQFVKAFKTVYSQISDNHPSYFEFLYFMAMVLFSWEKPDVILLETGLGGRLDATNSFEKPVLSMITRIGMDHMEYLGDTEEKIAAEKAGIVKKGAPLVYFAKNKSVSMVMESAAGNADIPAFSVKAEEIRPIKVHQESIDFSYDSRYYDCNVFRIQGHALYQRENAALVIKATEILNQQKVFRISLQQLKDGLYKTFWEGRMEEIAPDVFLDGAHNEDGIHAFLESAAARVCKGRKTLLFAVVSDKDYEHMIIEIVKSKLFEQIIVTTLKSSRAADAVQIAALFETYIKELGAKMRVLQIEPVENAYETVRKEKGAADQVYIAGSLYLVGQIKGYKGE